MSDVRTVPGSTSLLLVIALAVTMLGLVAVIVAWHAFDGLYGQDSFFYHAWATGPMRDALLAGRPLPLPDFTWSPGYPVVVALVSLTAGVGALAGQAVSLAAGASIPVATALLARQAWPAGPGRSDAWVPLIAAALVALTPHLWQSSAVAMSDTTGLAAAAWGAWAVLCRVEGGKRRWMVIGATALAFAIDVRWIYGLVALAVAGAVVWVARRNADRRTWADVALGVVVGAIALAPVVVPMLLAIAQGDTPPFSIQLRSHTWDPLAALRADFSGADGAVRYQLPMGAWVLLEAMRPYYLGPLFGACALMGLVRVLRRPDARVVAILVGWPALVMGFLAGDTYQNTRFFLAALPPVAILAALGVAGVADIAAIRLAGGMRHAGLALVASVVVVALGAMAVGAWRFTDAFIVRQQAELSSWERLAARVPPGSRLFSFGATLALRHAGFVVVELYDLEPADVVSLVADRVPTYLLVQEHGLRSQWALERPGRAFSALRDGPGLVRLAESGSWTLFIAQSG